MGLVELALAALIDVGFTLERARQVTVLVSFVVGHRSPRPAPPP
jgi:hypothetical protein